MRAFIRKRSNMLDKKEMIDRNHVGIAGFSRTVCFVAYTLTHWKFRFAAASLVDGIGCGYFDEMVSPNVAWDNDALNGGSGPVRRRHEAMDQEFPGIQFG